ncbi:DUF3289 family protein [Nissabacter sp. SGAir0207]|uniref:DUF3289 family protein n=1 Tax=Nissabacter sp. SGAir0207 TaxID=2126321 RepID=UPI001F0DC8C5|nr:DUF3289 family protein [Nissabacter sp. SGAir0207]
MRKISKFFLYKKGACVAFIYHLFFQNIGMVISVYETWLTYIKLELLAVEGDSYNARIHYFIQDHFGLDNVDTLNPVRREFRIFRLRFALQRWDEYGYKPFITEMNATIEITGREDE